MNRYANSRPLLLIIGVLLISNIVLLVLYLNKKPEQREETRSRSGKFTEFLKNDIGFAEQQIKEYQDIKDSHRQKMKVLFDDLQKTKTAFFLQLRDVDSGKVNLDSSAAVIGEKQAALDKQIYNHFSRLRTLCTPEQLQKFDSSFPEVIKRMTGGPGRDGRPRSQKENKE